MLVDRFLPTVNIYTEGVYNPKSDIGGWSVYFVCGDKSLLIFDRYRKTSNNQMELYAAVEALSMLKTKCYVNIYSDANYVVKGGTVWLHNWKRDRWRNSKGEPVQNKEMWLLFEKLLNKHIVMFHWVKRSQTISKGSSSIVKNNDFVDHFAGFKFI